MPRIDLSDDIAAARAAAAAAASVPPAAAVSPGWGSRRPVPDPEHVDPDTMEHLMVQCGWRVTSRRFGGSLVRLYPPGPDDRRAGHTICKDKTAPEYAEDMTALLTDLAGMAELGWLAGRVLAAVADGSRTAVDQASLLDAVVHSVWLHGKWPWLTRNMTSEQREAAVEAVLRYSRWQAAGDPGEEPLSRESVAVWEDPWYDDKPFTADGHNPLDEAMWNMWLNGDWQAATEKMGRQARELAAAAVLRHSQKLDPKNPDPNMRPLTRSQIVWWDR